MNSKKCEKVMNSFFELDTGARLELHDSLHLIFCKECRTKVRVLSKAEKIVQMPLLQKSEMQDSLLSSAIKSTNPSWMENLKPVSMVRWVLSGFLMILLFVLSGIFLEKIQNPDYLIWFYVIVGAVVTAYCGAFMAINMDFFIKKIDTSSLA